MPIHEENPFPLAIHPHQINVPAEEPGLFITVSIQGSSDTPTEVLDDTLMSLIDHLQTWPGRQQIADVTGSKYETLLFNATPTDPVQTLDEEE